MSGQYVQKTQIVIPREKRKFMLAGVALKLLSLGFILLAAFIDLYFLFGVFGLFLLGVAVSQVYNNAPKQFEYDFNSVRLVITKINVLNRRSGVLEVCFTDVESLEIFADIIVEGDVLGCVNPRGEGVYSLAFKSEGKTRRLLFEPDDYMRALISEALIAKEERVSDDTKQEKAESL